MRCSRVGGMYSREVQEGNQLSMKGATRIKAGAPVDLRPSEWNRSVPGGDGRHGAGGVTAARRMTARKPRGPCVSGLQIFGCSLPRAGSARQEVYGIRVETAVRSARWTSNSLAEAAFLRNGDPGRLAGISVASVGGLGPWFCSCRNPPCVCIARSPSVSTRGGAHRNGIHLTSFCHSLKDSQS